MATSTQQRYMLLAACCAVAAMPALGESVRPKEFNVSVDIAAADACRFTDPGDPKQILGPNPAHANCLTAFYSAPLQTESSGFDTSGFTDTSGSTTAPATEGSSLSVSLASTLWLYLVGFAMLILAGINSRKRPRHLPASELGGGFSRPGGRLHRQSEGSRWNED